MRAIKAASVFLIAVTLSCAAMAAAPEAEEVSAGQLQALPWQHGPAQGALGNQATVQIPAGGGMLPEGKASKFLELTGNLPDPETTILTGGNWWATFDFIGEGYVKDDEKIDAHALLKALKDNEQEGNAERKERGLPLLHIDGWYVEPHYDKTTNRLEWGVKLHSSDSDDAIVNYTVRILGRSGYESVTLVSDPASLDADVKEFKQVLASFEFNSGQKYAEFKPGDRVAAYGLGALVIGGAAAVAAKSGFWKVIVGALAAGWKLIAAGAVAVFAALGKIFSRKRKD
ncbi:MAG: DUF2167 domain-containing protein [Desulfovibrionaceae bacterium]|jgi:uncharacterized membrane-anchored protein|nr:DUF2167 domain-containing protein [Desulfovibrionaceae bacterium]